MKLSCKTISGMAVAAVLLAGCGSAPQERPEPEPGLPSSPQPYVPSRPAPQQSAPRPAPAPAYKPVSHDTCGADALQYLIGKPRTEIPVPLQPSQRRVVCSTCVTTQEFRADRQTIVFDTDTGLITSVKCG